ncbi:MAG: glycosyltransferase family 4 protein [Desulfobulbaceae bacterium]|nr:MAG: glycosyltransferase family 4 protein [Desulfobulbaceae bacterium]
MILYVHHGAVLGGAPTSLRNLVHGVSKEADFICCICCIWPEMKEYFSNLENVEVGSYPKIGLFSGRVLIGWSRGLSLNRFINFWKEILSSPYYIYKEYIFIKRKSPEIVHLNSSILWTSAIAARLCKIPVVWHIREASDDTSYNYIRKAYTWFIRKTAHAVICIGPQEYSKMGGERSSKVVKIYNSLAESFFIDQTYDKSVLRRSLDFPDQAFIYLSLGGLSFRKGTYQFIDALKFLPESIIAVLLGENRGIKPLAQSRLTSCQFRLEDFLVKKNLKRYFSWNYQNRVASLLMNTDKKRLNIAGVVDDVQPYIKACDVLIFAGTTPHSARPVYEAWALKKPVIVFDSEVMRQDIDDGLDGIIVKDHTAEALAEAIIQLKEDPELARKMGEAGYMKARERFSMKSNNTKIIQIYRDILGEDRI